MTENYTECLFFASCPKGTDDLLAEEIRQLGGELVRNSATGIQFVGGLLVAYKVCLWSRVANRVLLSLTPESDRPFIDSAEDLYQFVSLVAWEDHIDAKGAIVVDFSGTNKAIQNEMFGAAKIKDAIVDRLREKTGERPFVDRENPDVRINAWLNRDKLSLSIDLSGDSLHRRGYRVSAGGAPVKENLAAAMLLRAGWPAIAKEGGALVDPMCGSGTFLVEAALMAANVAPGLLRTQWGFTRWLNHDSATWTDCLREAEQLKQEGVAALSTQRIFGFDQDPSMVRKAQANIQRAGLSDYIRCARQALNDGPWQVEGFDKGLVITNPPYGVRLGEQEALRETYLSLSKVVKQNCANWTLAVLTGNADLAKEMRLRVKKRNKFMNGPIASELLISPILSADKSQLRQDEDIGDIRLSEGGEMVFNRLEKNRKKLAAWAEKNQIECYRLYDADIPEYAIAVDVYGQQVHVQEYAAPKTVDEQSARKRLRESVLAVSKFFGIKAKDIPVKTRQQNKGKQQYERYADTGAFFDVKEGKATFKINLQDYLDTGLFLDHRPLRLRLAKEAKGQRFLNLFCYTAAATVHAALGGAASTVSVDMSHTYLDWAKQNFALNHIQSKRHELVQADCLKWLASCRQGFDLIMLDPPSFSNSKRMEGVLDIQRDHVMLINRCMELLSPGGTLYFSTNLRRFTLDATVADKWQVMDITRDTIDKDFERNQKIHYCFKITH